MMAVKVVDYTEWMRRRTEAHETPGPKPRGPSPPTPAPRDRVVVDVRDTSRPRKDLPILGLGDSTAVDGV